VWSFFRIRFVSRKQKHVAAANPLTGWPGGSMLTAHTSNLPPPHGVPGWSTSMPTTRTVKPASAHNYLSCIYSHLSPNKASTLWTAVRYCTCSYLYLYSVGRYGRVCTCTATKLYFLFVLLLQTSILTWISYRSQFEIAAMCWMYVLYSYIQ